MGILTGIFGSSKAGANPVRVTTDDGFVDLELPLASGPQTTPDGHRLIAQGTYDGRAIGFSVEVHGEWTENPMEDNSATFYWGWVTLRSIGEPSDQFVAVLSKLYGITATPAPMLAEITAQAVGLLDDPRKLLDAPVRMKLFFHSEVEARYAEVFLNLDVPGRCVQFREKDQEYRANVVRALSEHA